MSARLLRANVITVAMRVVISAMESGDRIWGGEYCDWLVTNVRHDEVCIICGLRGGLEVFGMHESLRFHSCCSCGDV